MNQATGRRFQTLCDLLRRAIPLPVCVLCCLLLASGGGLTGCKTSKPQDRVEVRAGEPLQFNPTSAVARLRLGEGRYPTLYSSNAVAIWQGAETIGGLQSSELADPASDPEASASFVPGADPNFMVFECRLESAFADMSIAYDVVGFRGMHVYLQTPMGEKILPAQKVIGSELSETQQGALKVFARKNTLIFPRSPLIFPTPAPGQPAPTLRLVLEGYDSTYYFEWFPWLPDYVKEAPITVDKAKTSLKEGYGKSKRRFLDFSHKFD